MQYEHDFMAAGDCNDEPRPGFEMWIRGRLCRVEPLYAGPEPAAGFPTRYLDECSITPLDDGPSMLTFGDPENDEPASQPTLEETITLSEWADIDAAAREYDEPRELLIYHNADGRAHERAELGEL